MAKTNILFVITKLELGGAQKQLMSIIRHLDKSKFTPFLFTSHEGILLPEAVSIPGLNLISSRNLERQIHPLKDLISLVELYLLIKKNKITIVHTHSSKAGIVGRLSARLAGVKFIVHTVHGWSFNDYQSGFMRRLFILLEQICAKFCRKIIVVSLHDKEKGLKNGIGNDRQYALIYYGINYQDFFCDKKQKIRKNFGIQDDEVVVTNISCFKPQKSLFDFIKLAKEISLNHPRAKFLLVGDGVLRQKIEKLIKECVLGERVILAGWRYDVEDILGVTDVLVLTSLWEGMPISVLEAMAASCSVVATSTGGINEIVSDGRTGFLVEPRSIERMQEKLSLLLEDSALRRSFGENARNSLGERFTVERMAKGNQNIYEESLNEEFSNN